MRVTMMTDSVPSTESFSITVQFTVSLSEDKNISIISFLLGSGFHLQSEQQLSLGLEGVMTEGPREFPP